MQRFVTLVKQSQELKNVSYHKLYDILKQHQHEVNEIRAEKIARVANPLALVAQQQQVYHPQTHPTQYNQNSSTRTHQATRNRGKANVNSPRPIYDQEPSMVDDDDETSNDKEIDKLMALISLSEQIDQNDDDDDLSNECEFLASLITKLKCEIDDSKNRNKFLETSNKILVDKLKGMYKIHTDHTQARTSKLPQDSKKTNKRVSLTTGVIPTTSVSRPELKSNPMGDRVLHSNSSGKKLEVEEHRRNVKLSKNKMSVTACDDSLNAKTLNVKSVSTMFAKCVMIDKHDVCVPKSVAKPLRKTVASESNKKPRNNVRKLHERFGKIYKWSYIKFTPSGYMWKPKSPKGNVNLNVSLPLDNVSKTANVKDTMTSRRSIHMTRNLKLLINFVEKFLGTVKFGNDQIAPILGYGDLVQGAVTIKRVYYVEGLNHNLFFIGQFCDADLEVAFRKSTCFIRDLKGNDLLTAWLWHRRLSHLNFDTINLLSKNDIVVGLPKLKFIKDHLCSSCELGKAKRKSFHSKLTPSSKRRYIFYTWTYVVPCV
nr:hypothetical protein [Tanacetum cinerariifolium]